MHITIQAHGVNDAYEQGKVLMKRLGELSESRNGQVLKLPGPVMTAYMNPRQRWLFCPTRDANPFFHFAESMWMLAGQNDVKFVAEFNSTIGQFSDDGEILHGAYGHRWVNHFGQSQLDRIINELKNDPYTRRCVLTMWDAYIDPDVAALGGKDVPCNTHIYFNVRGGTNDKNPPRLDMTVCCRSNDMVWGAYGANAVHMSFLHEYVALATNIPMGSYYQLSNDFHVYERHFQLLETPFRFSPYLKNGGPSYERPLPLLYPQYPRALDLFHRDLEAFIDDPFQVASYDSEFFQMDAKPLALAWKYHKAKLYASAIEMAKQIESEDLRQVCVEWLDRRLKKQNERST